MRGGRAGFIGGAARLARHHTARRVMMPRESYSSPRGSLILPRQPPPNSPRFSHAYPFLTRFSRAVLEVFQYSKWVMQHIVGKLSTSYFPTAKIPVKRGMPPANRELPRRSWSRHLSNAPGPTGQLVTSRKDSAREGGCPGEKCVKSSAHFSLLFVPVCVFWTCGKPSLGFQDMVLRTGAAEVFLVRWRTFFRSRIPARPGKILAIREFHVVHERVLLSNVPGLAGSTCYVAPDIGFRRSWYRRKACNTYFSKRYRPCTEASLGSQDMILRTEAVGMFLMPRGHLSD
uniref:Uncharacterized protein n=1 Tax=Fagus sylvatica TaxID=28930 RepID=A0A2N9HCI5_FAGSY